MTDLVRTIEDLEVHKVLVVSTGHIPERDSLMLESAGNNDLPAGNKYIGPPGHEPKFVVDPLIVIRTGYGYQIYCSNIEDDGQVQSILDYGYTTALTDLLQLGFATGCRYVNIDCDGPVYESLATFNW